MLVLLLYVMVKILMNNYSLFLSLQGNNYAERVMLIYDGLHYDALAVWFLYFHLFCRDFCVFFVCFLCVFCAKCSCVAA